MCDPKTNHLFVTSGLPTQSRIQQNFRVTHPKIHDPGGQTTGFEDPCQTLTRRRIANCMQIPSTAKAGEQLEKMSGSWHRRGGGAAAGELATAHAQAL